MRPVPYLGAVLLALVFWVVRPYCACAIEASTSDLPDQAASSIDGEPSEDAVDTCERTRVSTYSRTLSYSWKVTDRSLYLYGSSSGNTKGKSFIQDTFSIHDQYGVNWTMKLSSRNIDKPMLYFNASIPNNADEYDVNLITGQLNPLLGDNYTIEDNSCWGKRASNQDNVTVASLWTGYCHVGIEYPELNKILENDSIWVSLELHIVYESHSRKVSSNIRECKELKFDALGPTQLAIMKENTEGLEGQTDIPTGSHRVSLKWSISKWWETLKPWPRGTDWLQSILIETAEQPRNGLTWVEISRDGSGSGQNIQVDIGVYSPFEPSITGLRLAVVTIGNNHTNRIPEAGIVGHGHVTQTNFTLTDADLEQWNKGVVFLMEYVVVHANKSAATTEAFS